MCTNEENGVANEAMVVLSTLQDFKSAWVVPC